MSGRLLVAIDPGASGAIAWADGAHTTVHSMPDTPMDMLHLFALINTSNIVRMCLCEKVGGYRPGNSAPAAVKFARHCGHLDMALLAASIPHKFIAPGKWMKAVMGTVPKDKKERKNAIKQEMQRLYPQLKVTLTNADALGILTYLKMNGPG